MASLSLLAGRTVYEYPGTIELLNELGKRGKIRGLSNIFSIFERRLIHEIQ